MLVVEQQGKATVSAVAAGRATAHARGGLRSRRSKGRRLRYATSVASSWRVSLTCLGTNDCTIQSLNGGRQG